MAFATRASRHHQEQDLGHNLPIVHHEGAQVGGAIGAMIFGGIFSAFPVFFLVATSLDDESLPWFAYVVLGVFLLVGLLIEAAAVNALLHKLDLHIDAKSVKGSRRSLKGARSWHEALSIYSGVLPEEEYHSGGKNRSSYTLHKVTLKHSTNKDYDVLLFSSRSGAQHRAKTEAYARLFERPVLSLQADGTFSERAVEDLDKSVSELVAEGKLEAQFNPYDQPEGKLKVEKLPAGYRFDHSYGTGMSVITSTIFMFAGIGILYWYFGPGLPESVDGSPWVMVVVGLVFTLIGIAGWLFALFANSTLFVEREGLRTEIKFLQWTFGKKQLDSGEIEEVSVGKDKQGKLELLTSTDHNSISYGKHILSEDEMMFVRSCVIATTARHRY